MKLIFDRDETRVWLLAVPNVAALRRKAVLQMLAKVTGLPESNIVLDKTLHGKPILPGAAFDWNVSYTSGHLAFGISLQSRIGIDIEDTTRIRAFDDIAKNFFTPRERAQCRTPSDFYTIWTAKESLMKAVGLGFNLEPKTFSLAINDEEILVEEIEGYQRECFRFKTTLEGSIRVCSCTFTPA